MVGSLICIDTVGVSTVLCVTPGGSDANMSVYASNWRVCLCICDIRARACFCDTCMDVRVPSVDMHGLAYIVSTSQHFTAAEECV